MWIRFWIGKKCDDHNRIYSLLVQKRLSNSETGLALNFFVSLKTKPTPQHTGVSWKIYSYRKYKKKSNTALYTYPTKYYFELVDPNEIKVINCN